MRMVSRFWCMDMLFFVVVWLNVILSIWIFGNFVV